MWPPYSRPVHANAPARFVGQLGPLKFAVPRSCRTDRHQRLAGRHDLPYLHARLGDHPGDRGPDRRVGDVELGLGQDGLRLGQARFGRRGARANHGDLGGRRSGGSEIGLRLARRLNGLVPAAFRSRHGLLTLGPLLFGFGLCDPCARATGHLTTPPDPRHR
jgi:hypothetical protein